MSDLDNTENPQPRRRGAPEGNINALKHGFYSRRFRNSELEDLLKQPAGELQDEIAMLRIMNRRVVDMAEEGKSTEEILEFYNFIALTSMRLSTLLRTQKLLLTEGPGKTDGVMAALEKVIDETLEKHRQALAG